MVDKGPSANLPKVSASALWKVTGPFHTNTVLAANDGVGDQVVTINLQNGKLTPFVRHLNTTKGLVYLNPDGSQTQLSLSGAPTTAVATPAASTHPVAKASSNTVLIVVLIAVAVLLVGGGGFGVMRRRAA